ncbi:NTP transferase domain-containing protein [Halorarius halobius]|uniref:NTP transferase domain-containing protein n=1 Tax=Halorarius halobius TaxID=2962671 RepID=UPI0020CE1C00|nr:NTP transferase domain-containing protein [Halorarius halobius]
MCGGRGSRLDAAVEKPLFEVGGVPMVDAVRRALAESRVETVHAVVSPQAPDTHDHLCGELPCIATPGDGYVADLGVALEQVDEPVVTVAADLPLLASETVDRVLDAADGATSVVVPRALKEQLGVAPDYDRAWVPAGLNVVAPGEDSLVRSWDARLAVNVNRKRDAAVAERLFHES